MQRIFAENTDWRTPWIDRIAPNVARLAERSPKQTIFTRFIPARAPEAARGAWRRYYERWSSMTLDHLDPNLLDLTPPLRAFSPPAAVVDKTTYSPWMRPALPQLLLERGAHALIISGAETDVCVLATALGAIDRGYRVVIAMDAICSSSDETHDALKTLYGRRFSQQVEAATVDEIVEEWRD